MNSKTLLLYSSLIFSLGCGVKSPPKPPAGTILPSYVDKFLEKDEEKDVGKKKESPSKK